MACEAELAALELAGKVHALAFGQLRIAQATFEHAERDLQMATEAYSRCCMEAKKKDDPIDTPMDGMT